MKRNHQLFFIALSTLFVFSSCGMIIKSYIRKDKENIPPDFGKEKTTLLVLNERKGYTKKVEKIVKDHYSGAYIFASKGELDSKYSDEDKYRYVLDDEILVSRGPTVVTHTTNLSTGFTSTDRQYSGTASRSFNIRDRKTNKTHDTGVSSGTSWKTILKAYLKKLDSERKKKEGLD